MENKTKDKIVIKRFGPKGSAWLVLCLSAVWLYGSYISINEHYPNIEESHLSLALVILAVLMIILSFLLIFYAFYVYIKHVKNT